MFLSRKPLALDRVWRRLADLVTRAWEPESVARLGSVSRFYKSRLLAWLTPLEAIARRLVLLEALRMPPPEAGRRAAPNAGAFALIPRAPRKRAAIYRKRTNKDQPALPLARRIERLHRLIADPRPHVRRLARLLHAQPDIARRILAAKPRHALFASSSRLLRVLHERAEADLALLRTPQSFPVPGVRCPARFTEGGGRAKSSAHAVGNLDVSGGSGRLLRLLTRGRRGRSAPGRSSRCRAGRLKAWRR